MAPLWGKTASAATNKPKWLPEDENSDYNREASYATASGWVMRAGTPASGNDNSGTLSYPAGYSDCIAVGAMSPCNERKNFSFSS